jgi:hypothetical protein
MAKQSPGLAPLGWPPGSKEKLEGPKKKHDNHGPDASVPAKGNAPVNGKQHWEQHYKYDPTATNTPAGAFLPKRSKDRPQPHSKVNECDH